MARSIGGGSQMQAHDVAVREDVGGPTDRGQLGNPHGILGHLEAWTMARGHAGLNRRIVEQGRDACPGERTRIVELGSGGRVAVRELLRVFPAAKVWGVDPSPIMVAQSRRRNRRAVEGGRLTLIEGDGASAAAERSGRRKE